MREDETEPQTAPDRAPPENDGRHEDEILICCALRFDGYAYVEAAGLTFPETTNRVVDDGIWPESREERLTVFFGLQRYLYKWGAEYEPRNGKCWRSFRTLFLDLHDAEIPERFRRAEYADEWDRMDPDRAVAVVRRI